MCRWFSKNAEAGGAAGMQLAQSSTSVASLIHPFIQPLLFPLLPGEMLRGLPLQLLPCSRSLLFTPSFSLTHTRTHTHLYPPFICIARDYKLITIQMKMRIFHLKSRVCPLPGEIINDKHTHEAVILFFFF